MSGYIFVSVQVRIKPCTCIIYVYICMCVYFSMNLSAMVEWQTKYVTKIIKINRRQIDAKRRTTTKRASHRFCRRRTIGRRRCTCRSRRSRLRVWGLGSSSGPVPEQPRLEKQERCARRGRGCWVICFAPKAKVSGKIYLVLLQASGIIGFTHVFSAADVRAKHGDDAVPFA